MKMQITIDVEKCKECNGTGKVEKCEYTPPFEKFKGACDNCGGTGVIQK